MILIKKLKSVLLVDDDDDCNFFHQEVLERADCTDKINIAFDGKQALDFLQSCINTHQQMPDIIFLDINMPGMNGWEFLDEYEKLDWELRKDTVVIMLTSSLNPDDKRRAFKYRNVRGFKNKYLDDATLNQLLKEHFPENI